MARDNKTDLTEAIVKSLQADASKDTYYNDSTQEGLVLIVRKGGRKVYALRTRDKQGTQIKKTIGNANSVSLKSARAAAKMLCSQLVQGQNPFPKIKDDKAKTFAAVYDSWREWSETHREDPKSYYKRQSMRDSRGALSYFNDIPLDKIDKVKIEDYQAEKVKINNKASTINRHITELKFITRWAVDHGIIDNHQLDGVKRLPELDSTPKTHHFSSKERNNLLSAADKLSKTCSGGHNMAYILPLTQLLLATGMRPGSALGLIWDDVDLLNGVIKLRAANIKTRKDARIYLSPQMTEIIRNWKGQTTGQPQDHVFPGDGRTIKSVKNQYKRLFEKAGLDSKYSVYSLRHDCASELLLKGANLTDVQMVLIHTDPRTTKKYGHESPERLREVAALLDNDNEGTKTTE